MTLGEVILPWPPRALWPNDRTDRRRATGDRRAYKEAACWLCLEAGLGRLPYDALHVSITFCPPTRGRRDLDNMVAAVKAGLDGIVRATKVDDSVWTLSIQRGDPEKPGCVRVRIETPEGGA